MKHYTPLERAWILYDVGNSAFVLLISTIIPIYFNYLAEEAGLSSVTYLAYWGYAASAATLAVAVIGPVFGAVADTKNYKKKVFLVSVLVGVAGCVAMGVAATWLTFLVIFVIARIGYSSSLVFYDSMLHDVTEPERLDDVSSQGYAWGYIGSCIPFIVSLGIVLGAGSLGLTMQAAMGVSFLLVALWWLLASTPAAAPVQADPLCGEGAGHGGRELCAPVAHLKRAGPGPEGAALPSRLLLLYRRRVHHHRHGNRLRDGAGT